MALAFAPFNRPMKVTAISLDEKTRRHLENLGLIIGGEVTTLQDSGGSLILRVKGTKLAINRAVAMKIIVA